MNALTGFYWSRGSGTVGGCWWLPCGWNGWLVCSGFAHSHTLGQGFPSGDYSSNTNSPETNSQPRWAAIRGHWGNGRGCRNRCHRVCGCPWRSYWGCRWFMFRSFRWPGGGVCTCVHPNHYRTVGPLLVRSSRRLKLGLNSRNLRV